MNPESTELVPQQQQLASVPATPAPSVGAMLSAVIERGVTQENIGALEKLVGLYERMELRDAEKQFNAAFVALQTDIPVIVATSIIPNRGKYERYEDVMKVVNPLLQKHGFSVSFSMDFNENRVIETCKLSHIAGHSQSNSFAVRTGGKADSDTQADCKAATTAKRNALLNCLNIVIRQDALQNEEDDASLEGALIGRDHVAYLREQLAELKPEESAKFLAFAAVEKLEEIRMGAYPILARSLEAKVRAAKKGV